MKNENIIISHSAKYNKKYNANTHIVETVVKKFYPILQQEFNVPSYLKVKLRPIYGTTLGQCFSSHDIEVECRRTDIEKIARTLAHEFKHAEQFYQNKLVNGKNFFIWDSVKYSSNVPYAEYLDQPWEIEAIHAEEYIVKKYSSVIKKLTEKRDMWIPYLRRI